MIRTGNGPPVQGNQRAAEALAGSETHLDRTPTVRQLAPCPPRCALRCTLPAAWWQDVPADPDPWLIAYALHGLGRGKPPVPPTEYATALRWFAAVWDVETVAAGLRHAASIPPVHGSGVDRSRLEALAAMWGEHAREVTA